LNPDPDTYGSRYSISNELPAKNKKTEKRKESSCFEVLDVLFRRLEASQMA
jgi:hypothetical protein